ncbi:hypothetical protein DZF91_01815 [Actinomadura logoneensis]|uniref:Uncharacterized protein n=1 Tax=Actinomadura logoneensis TaxID=2293572 RepID=A0A372JTM4_9ACTN|nr:hypothetical protein [Actinomadura logoneensis]RFU43299.1 hypothetical protein DZF91_01815 [Actinomadura logoneensis]
MSRELVVLLPEPPDIDAALSNSDALRDAALSIGHSNGATLLFDAGGRLLVFIAEPRRVEVPGETERLLNVPVPVPTWWIDIRAAATPDTASTIAHHCAEALTHRHNGILCATEAPA